MKAKEKRMILILVLITIAMLIITVIVKNNNKQQEVTPEQGSGLVKQQEDGTKQSISGKLQETKKIEDLDVSNIQIIEVNGEATITANITNDTLNTKKEFPITIKVLNKQGEVIQEVGAYVGKMQKGETRAINASVSMDISEIYDVKFEKK